jgi:hypothetical protein
MSLGTSNRDGGKTSESGHLRALAKIVSGDIITGLNAVQRAAGVNMSVDVQVGDAFVRRSDDTYAHPVFNDAVYNQVISAADGSNPRRDIVVIYVDYGQTPSTAVSNNTNGVVKIKVVNGTPAGSPVDPNGAAIQASVGAGNPYSILARVRVPAGQTSIGNSLIDDLRSMTSANLKDATVTTAKQKATTLMLSETNGIALNTNYQAVASVTLPAVTAPHKYLINSVFAIANMGSTTNLTYAGYVYEGANGIGYVYGDMPSGSYTMPALNQTAIFTSSATGGQTITFGLKNVTATSGQSSSAGSFTIVDLGCA